MGLESITGALFVGFVGMVPEHPASTNRKINRYIEVTIFILFVLFIQINLLKNINRARFLVSDSKSIINSPGFTQ